MSKTTIEIRGEPSIEAQRKAWNVLAKAYGRRHGVELTLTFEDEEQQEVDKTGSDEGT